LSSALRGTLLALCLTLSVFGSARGQELRPYTVVGDAILTSLTGAPGDPTRGRAVVTNRQNTCLLCHTGPFPEERFQGNLAPDLRGTGARWSQGQIRLRVVDARRVNPATIMPPFHATDGLKRVGGPWRDKPILSVEQIEDVVAYLSTLRD
jgi:L-cysteine S-thiosulfotransferase